VKFTTQNNKLPTQAKLFYGIWSAVGAIVLLGVCVYLMKILALPVSMLIWTLIFVFCLRGIVNKLDARGVNRVLGTAVAYVVMFGVLAIIAMLMFSPIFGLNNQFIDLISAIPGYIDQLTQWFNAFYSDNAQWFENETVKNVIDNVGASVSQWASSFASGTANTVIDVGAGVANSIMAIGFALVIAFWILMELPAIGREAKRIINPKYYDDASFLHITFTRIMGGYIKGTLIQCMIIGAGCGVLFAVLGVANAPALGVITGILNIIPIIGPWLGGAVAAISAVFVSPVSAVISLLGTIVIQQFVYTFVSPKIMSSSVDIHPALTLVAMMVGSALGGAMNGLSGSLVGMLFAIPAVAVIKACFAYYFERATGRKVVSPEGVFFKGSTEEYQAMGVHSAGAECKPDAGENNDAEGFEGVTSGADVDASAGAGGQVTPSGTESPSTEEPPEPNTTACKGGVLPKK
jgi:predicted PurR-regulated permease PerM